MKKLSTTYNLSTYTLLTVNEEVKDHMSIHDYGEPCSGILKHWGSKSELIKELKEIIMLLEEF